MQTLFWSWLKTQVCFVEIVLVKVGWCRTMMLLKGFTLPGSTFYKKQQENKLNMCKIYYQRELTSKWMKIQQHVYDTSAKVNLWCFCFLIDLPSIQTTKCVEVSKHKEIDVDVLLTSIPKPEMTQPQCPRCLVDMTFGCILRYQCTPNDNLA